MNTNDQNRMTYSATRDIVENTRTVRAYRYDAYGRRTLAQDQGGDAMRTLYDAFSFEAIREGVTFADGSFTTQFSTSAIPTQTMDNPNAGTRYRWIGEDQETTRIMRLEEDASPRRYTGISVTLYGRRAAVATTHTGSAANRGGMAYLGTDILGSVRSATNALGTIEDRYEYDAFGTPYKGDLTGGMSLGYTGKPYDVITGLYNYGYRDYQPQVARFTTIAPIRDGGNWFAYINNDPINWIDPDGLQCMSSVDRVGSIFAGIGAMLGSIGVIVATIVEDALTGGAGIADDPVTLGIGAALFATGFNLIKTGLSAPEPVLSFPTSTEDKGPTVTEASQTTLQSGDTHTITKRTADALNKEFEENLYPREWGRALEDLKDAHDIPNDSHGSIKSNGDYYNDKNEKIGNIGEYL
jgi:RHS repeat-associated protein